MNGANTIINVFKGLVALMTPVITIDDNVAEATNWRLSICNTYWLFPKSTIIIGGESFKVLEVVINESILVSGAAQPGATSFQLEAPEFVHGNPRKVNNELKRRKNLKPPFIYLPTPEVTEDREDDSDVAYMAAVRPLFLKTYNVKRDTIDLQQAERIEPLNQMVDLFLYLIEDNQGDFNEPDRVTRKEWISWGDPTTWGNDKLIFDQPQAGVGAVFQLDVLYDSGFLCCDDQPVITCPDVTKSFNGTATGIDTAAGQNIDFQVVDDLGDPTGTLELVDPNTVRVVVTGGGGLPVTSLFNSVPTGVDTPCGQALSIAVLRTSAPALVGTLVTNTPNAKGITVGDCVITFNAVAMLNAPPEFAINYKIVNQDNIEVGSQKDSTTWEVDVPAIRPVRHYSDIITSQHTGDDADQRAAGVYDGGMLRSFYRLYAGAFADGLSDYAHEYRLVGKTGGYTVKGVFFDVNGVATTEALAFPDDMLFDQLTGWQIRRLRGGTLTWTAGIDAVIAASFDGHLDWILGNIKMFLEISDFDISGNIWTGSGIFNNLTLTSWTSSPYAGNPAAQSWRMDTLGRPVVSIISQTNAITYWRKYK